MEQRRKDARTETAWSIQLAGQNPHCVTVSYAFCKRFPPKQTTEIFEHIRNKSVQLRMVAPA